MRQSGLPLDNIYAHEAFLSASAEAQTLALPDDWAEPAIADRIIECYAAVFHADVESAAILSRQHIEFWRRLFRNETERAAQNRRDLEQLAQIARLPDDALDEIDALAFDELSDLIAMRFRRSQSALRQQNRRLVQLTAIWSQSRVA